MIKRNLKGFVLLLPDKGEKKNKNRSVLASVCKVWLHARFKPHISTFSLPGDHIVRTASGLKFRFLSVLDELVHCKYAVDNL